MFTKESYASMRMSWNPTTSTRTETGYYLCSALLTKDNSKKYTLVL